MIKEKILKIKNDNPLEELYDSQKSFTLGELSKLSDILNTEYLVQNLSQEYITKTAEGKDDVIITCLTALYENEFSAHFKLNKETQKFEYIKGGLTIGGLNLLEIGNERKSD